MSELAELAKRRLEELISFFEINVEAEVRETEDGIELDVASTPATARLIGHHGETLKSIEYLVNMMVKRATKERVRVIVDVAGYRKARYEALRAEAREAAEKLAAEGGEIELRPMNPAERRIVHMELAEHPDVATESRGEEPKRRIIIRAAQ